MFATNVPWASWSHVTFYTVFFNSQVWRFYPMNAN